MSDFLVAPAARDDLDEIWSHYAVELQNLDAADRIRDEIFDSFEKLAQMPGMGHLRRDLASEPLRFWPVRSYLIIYRREKRPIEIVRVLHGARDAQTILGRTARRNHPKK